MRGVRLGHAQGSRNPGPLAPPINESEQVESLESMCAGPRPCRTFETAGVPSPAIGASRGDIAFDSGEPRRGAGLKDRAPRRSALPVSEPGAPGGEVSVQCSGEGQTSRARPAFRPRDRRQRDGGQAARPGFACLSGMVTRCTHRLASFLPARGKSPCPPTQSRFPGIRHGRNAAEPRQGRRKGRFALVRALRNLCRI